MLADVGRQLQVPQCIVVTDTRPDTDTIYTIGCLTIPFEDAIEEAFERKTLKYPELVVASTHTTSGGKC